MTPITTDDYFGKWKPTRARDVQNAKALLATITPLLEAAAKAGVVFTINPNTATLVSGEQYGGYRPPFCPIGAPESAHKTGEAIDIYDPLNALDTWLNDKVLEKYNLYREHPSATTHWCHLTTRRPGSGNRSFHP